MSYTTPHPPPTEEPPAELPDLDHLTMVDFRHIYEPSDDTFLLMDALEADSLELEALRPRIVMEIGSGSGCATAVLARTLTKALGPSHRTLFFATDINERAIRATQATGVANQVPYLEPLQVDLLLPLLPRLLHSIDILLFNPPYVPTPSSEVGSRGIEASWAGGEDGREVLNRLLPSIPSLLSPHGGCMYLVAVNENRPEEICARMRKAGLEAKVVRTRKARNEVLSILKFVRP